MRIAPFGLTNIDERGDAESLARGLLKKKKATRVLSPLTPGWSLAVANAALQLGVPLSVVLPYYGYGVQWGKEHFTTVMALLEEATERDGCDVLVIAQRYPLFEACRLTEVWLVEQADLVAMLWDGSPDPRLTRVAKLAGYKVFNLWRSWVKGRSPK